MEGILEAGKQWTLLIYMDKNVTKIIMLHVNIQRENFKKIFRAGDMGQWLKLCTAAAKDQSSVPSTEVWSLTVTFN